MRSSGGKAAILRVSASLFLLAVLSPGIPLAGACKDVNNPHCERTLTFGASVERVLAHQPRLPKEKAGTTAFKETGNALSSGSTETERRVAELDRIRPEVEEEGRRLAQLGQQAAGLSPRPSQADQDRYKQIFNGSSQSDPDRWKSASEIGHDELQRIAKARLANEGLQTKIAEGTQDLRGTQAALAGLQKTAAMRQENIHTLGQVGKAAGSQIVDREKAQLTGKSAQYRKPASASSVSFPERTAASAKTDSLQSPGATQGTEQGAGKEKKAVAADSGNELRPGVKVADKGASLGLDTGSKIPDGKEEKGDKAGDALFMFALRNAGKHQESKINPDAELKERFGVVVPEADSRKAGPEEESEGATIFRRVHKKIRATSRKFHMEAG